MNTIVDTALQQLVVPFVALVLGGLASILAHRVIKLVEQKWGMRISEANEQKLDEILEKGIHFAEGWATAQLKAKQPKPAPETKAEKAVQWVIDEVKRNNLDQLAADKIKALVQAKFGQMVIDEKVTSTPINS